MPAKPVKEPRDIYEIQAVVGLAKEIYLSLGGHDIDVQIDAMTLQADAFCSQMAGAKLMRSDVGPGAWGPTITPHAASAAAGHATRLLRLREGKLAYCISLAEEHIATENAKAEKKRESASGNREPEVPDSPVRKDRGSSDETSDQEAAAAKQKPEVQAEIDDGDSPQLRGQSPTAFPGVHTVIPEHLQRGRA